MHEWLSGGASPCQGEGRGFESRLVLAKVGEESLFYKGFSFFYPQYYGDTMGTLYNALDIN